MQSLHLTPDTKFRCGARTVVDLFFHEFSLIGSYFGLYYKLASYVLCRYGYDDLCLDLATSREAICGDIHPPRVSLEIPISILYYYRTED
jgi:hypothetical protein